MAITLFLPATLLLPLYPEWQTDTATDLSSFLRDCPYYQFETNHCHHSPQDKSTRIRYTSGLWLDSSSIFSLVHCPIYILLYLSITTGPVAFFYCILQSF